MVTAKKTKSLKTPTEAFSLQKLRNLSKDSIAKKKAKEYISQYFIPLHTNDDAVLTMDKEDYTKLKWEIVVRSKNGFIDRFGKDLKRWYLTEYTGVRYVVSEADKPLFIDEDKFNIDGIVTNNKKTPDKTEFDQLFINEEQEKDDIDDKEEKKDLTIYTLNLELEKLRKQVEKLTKKKTKKVKKEKFDYKEESKKVQREKISL